MSKSWKAFLLVSLANCLILVIIVGVLVRRELNYVNGIDTTTMLKIKVVDTQEMIYLALDNIIQNLNVTRKPGIDSKISIHFKEIGDNDLADTSALKKMQIGIYYEDTPVGRKVIQVMFGKEFIKNSYFGNKHNQFITEFNSIQQEHTKLQSADDWAKGYAYSNQQLEVLKSYIPILLVLHREAVYSTGKTLRVLKRISPWGSHIQDDLSIIIQESRSWIKTIKIGWTMTFVPYVWANHRIDIYLLNSIRLGKVVLIFGVLANLLAILCLHFFRRDFWCLLSEELSEQGLSLNFSAVWSLTKSNFWLIIVPTKTSNVRNIIRKECIKLKEEEERRNIYKTAKKVFQEIKTLLDVNDSQFGILKHSYGVIIDPKESIDKAWRNLTRLECQLRNIKLRQQEPSEKEHDTNLAVSSKGNKSIKRNSRNRDLITDLSSLLPLGNQLNLSTWSENNLHCLSRALIILPELHSEAISQLLDRDDLKNLMMRRSPFVKAIETGNKEIIFKKLNISLHRRISKEEQLSKIKSTQLNGELKVVVIGAGKVIGKKKAFEKALVDLGSCCSRFVDANNLQKIKAAAHSAKGNKNVLVILMRKHISHKISWEMKNVRNVIYVDSLSPKRFKEEVIKGYIALKK